MQWSEVIYFCAFVNFVFSTKRGAVAQWLKQLTALLMVAGSSPALTTDWKNRAIHPAVSRYHIGEDQRQWKKRNRPRLSCTVVRDTVGFNSHRPYCHKAMVTFTCNIKRHFQEWFKWSSALEKDVKNNKQTNKQTNNNKKQKQINKQQQLSLSIAPKEREMRNKQW